MLITVCNYETDSKQWHVNKSCVKSGLFCLFFVILGKPQKVPHMKIKSIFKNLISLMFNIFVKYRPSPESGEASNIIFAN